MVCYPAWERESHFVQIWVKINPQEGLSTVKWIVFGLHNWLCRHRDQYFKLFWPVWQFSWLNLEHTHSHNNDSGTIVNITYWNIALLTNLVNVLVFLTLHSVFLRYNCSSPNHKYINHTCGLSQVHFIVLNKDDCKMNESFHTLISRTRKFNSTR